MKSLLISLIALTVSIGVSGASSSSSGSIDWSQHQWEAPLPTDSRGPCPGLNTLANHGFLPRNGSNITIPIVLGAIQDGFNFQPTTLMRTVAKLGLLTTDNADNFDLKGLALHGTLEHDASLSRNDLAIGDNIHFQRDHYYNVTSAAQVLVQRLAEDSLINQTSLIQSREFTVRIIESGFYLSVIGNVTTGVAPKNFIQIFFEQERLPLEEGWHRSDVLSRMTTSITSTDAIGEAVTEWEPSGPIVFPEGEVTIVPVVEGTDDPQ
ncbi:Chloroperoxidase [Rhodocollybia butyracea]|uniref:Chloroperoxidase n=1 Tax=Rhodocollybia butyracea TaxID=206335 RepID=A0A9P5P617_9AGAR|nr:Chloroperoxidase [Rhodocollybia butyracea]